MQSPQVSPRKSSQEQSETTGSVQSAQSNSVRKEVARLSISETDEIKQNILRSLKMHSDTSSIMLDKESSGAIKRRRSSTALVNQSEIFIKSRQNSVTSGKVIKKKKKNSSLKPIQLLVHDNFFQRDIDKAKRKNRVSIKDIRDLILFLENGSNNSPAWININNRSSVGKVVVLFTPGLEPQDYQFAHINNNEGNSEVNNDNTNNDTKNCNSNQDSSLPNSFFDNRDKLRYSQLINNDHIKQLENIPISAPGSRLSLFSAYNSFINVGLTKNEKIQLKNELAGKKIVVTDLLMCLDSLLENNYPIHLETIGLSTEYKEKLGKLHTDQPGWVNTLNSTNIQESHIYGIDCEMCMAQSGLVVTRVSIINFQLETIYDKLVKPDVEIIDYLTKYSGITKEKLSNVTTTLQDVQMDILQLINSNDILVGHSLQSDFKVLKLRHPKVIDTAIIFDHKAGPPFKPSLKYLALEYLHTNIQQNNNDEEGHNPVEDARTCIELLKLKILKGLSFGVSVDTENLFRRLSKLSQKRSLILNDSVATINHKDNNIASIRCNSDGEIINNIREHINDSDLFVGRLRDLEFAREYSKPSLISNREIPTDANETVTHFNQLLNQLYDSLPINSLIVLLSGSGNTREWQNIMNELNRMDTKEARLKRKQELEDDIEQGILKARDGIATIITKN